METHKIDTQRTEILQGIHKLAQAPSKSVVAVHDNAIDCSSFAVPEQLVESRPHATLLTEVGESIKTAQALLGHSDLGTTLNTYSHVIPNSQRRAVERIAGVLFSNALEFGQKVESGKIN